MTHPPPPEEILDDPIELITSLPFKEEPLSPHGKSLIKLASKINELVRSANKHHGKKVKFLDARAEL